MNLDGFTKVQVSDARNYHKSLGIDISFREQNRSIKFSSELCTRCGFKSGDRVDLYKNGKMFAIKKDKVGCLTLRSNGKGTSSCIVRGWPIWLEIVPLLPEGKDTKLNITCDEGVVFFAAQE